MTTHSSSMPSAARLASGVPGLDVLLSGGFFKSGVYIVQGLPGSGKTILANQIAYNHVRGNGTAVYVTLLAESHSRMLQHLRPMSFFNDAALPEGIAYISAFNELETEGLKGLVGMLRREMRARRASLLILDGLVAAAEAAESDRELKKFVHEIQSNAAFLDCTVFLLTSGSIHRMNAEHTMVDGLIELEEHLYEVRTERFIHVRKFRGAPPIGGKHSFRITSDGIRVYPRLESLYRSPPDETIAPASRSTGIDDLDALIAVRGYPGESATIVVGSTGTGKTTTALHFVRKASAEEPALYFGFFEPPRRLREKARAMGWALEPLEEQGLLAIEWHAPGEYILDELGHRLIERVLQMRAKRVVIDGLSGLAQTAVNPHRLSRFLSSLINELRRLGATVLMTLETRDAMDGAAALPIGVSAYVDNLVFLHFAQQGGELRRLLAITKMRDSEFQSGIREVFIGAGGMRIASRVSSAGKAIPHAEPMESPIEGAVFNDLNDQ